MAFNLAPPDAVTNNLPLKPHNGVPNNDIRQRINDVIAAQQSTAWVDDPEEFRLVVRPPVAKSTRRHYIGGSVIGGECQRAKWYGFHWATKPEILDPRVLRLFERGHLEEFRFVKWLRMIGCEVQEYDPDTVPILWYHPESDDYFCSLPTDKRNEGYAAHCTDVSNTFHEWIARSRGVKVPDPQQFAWSDIDGHHLGNCDGRARNVPGVERWGVRSDQWIMLEFKTHNDKSFNELVDKGVYQAKPEHFHQTQSYMNHMDYPLTLYGAVNKNNDDLYFEFVPQENGLLETHRTWAREAIYSEKPPRRVNNSPSYFKCKWCDARPHCHYGVPLERNCRTCVSSIPVANGSWHCRHWGKDIPRDYEEKACGSYTMRTD